MPFIAFILIIVAALFHATWNFIAKKSGGTTLFAFVTAVVTVIIWFPVILILWTVNPEVWVSTWSTESWIFVALSALIHAVYYIVLLHGYKAAPLSIVYPVARGTGPLLSFFVAIFLFGELLTIYSFLGVSGIVAGILLLTWSKDISSFDGSSIRGLGWGIFTGITISLYTITDAYAVKTLGMNPILFDYFSNAIRVIILLPFVWKRRVNIAETFRQNKRGIVAISVFGPLAYVLVLTAIQIAPVSHVAPAREISMLVGAFLGGKLLNEGHVVRRMFGALLIALGVICLVL